MQIFSVTSRGRDGSRPRLENVWAIDAQDARERVVRSGRDVLRVQPRTVRSWSAFWRVNAFSESLLRSVAQQSFAVPAQQALADLIRRETDPWKMAVLAPAKTALDAGANFVQALRALELYDEATLTIIGAGEKAGQLDEAVAQAVEQVRAKRSRARATRAFLVGLASEWSALFSGVSFVRSNYLPGLMMSGIRTDDAALRARFDFGLATVRTIMDTAFVLMTSVTVIGGVLVLVRFAFRGRRNHWSARIVQAVPGLRASVQHDALSLSMAVAARLLRAGEAVGHTVQFAREVSQVPAVQAYWDSVHAALDVVEPARAFARAPLDGGERAQIGQARQMADIAAACERIAEQRAEKAKTTRRRTLVLGLSLFGVLVAVALGGIAWLLSLQLTASQEAVRHMTKRR
ncbi:hypothetical protein ABMY26_07320 (plasmid) [Azospirillum sp. HJ39]|uniref:hypothetical protein n=1 Tax=Azospirillum sp. HJ39 TaxID=3159496 RepID=UPI0035575F82